MKPQNISSSELEVAFLDEQEYGVLAEFSDCWQTELGHLFEQPDSFQLVRWCRQGCWDTELLRGAVISLKMRMKPGARKPLDPARQYEHGCKYVSATLKRRALEKYSQRKAA